MELKCTINGAEYKIEQGATFVENYNETLDSGTLSIVHIKKIKDLQPYNDVFIYDYNYTFVGYITRLPGISIPFDSDTIFRLIFKKDGTRVYIDQKYSVSETNSKDITYSYVYKDENGNTVEPFFFKHLLIDSFKETQLRIGNAIYNYEIDLCSEISRLEKVSVPNISITMDLKHPKSCWFYLSQYVELYSPKIKVTDTVAESIADIGPEARIWRYSQRYVLDPSLFYVFKDVSCPEMSWSNPSLRDVLSQIMIVKDMIPYVENDVIKGLDITKTHGEFAVDNPSCSFRYANMSKNDFATDARREYSGAISNENSARLVELLGFRQPNNAIMSLYNMVLETRYPIYKINRLLMCYYKRIVVNGEDKVFLCKQDITDFVLLDTVRNTLKTDWKSFNDDIRTNNPNLIKEYQLATVGYSIGSKTISGWGTYYEYPTVLWFSNGKTYIENLVELCGSNHPFGIYNKYTFGLTDQDRVTNPVIGGIELTSEVDKIIAYKRDVEFYELIGAARANIADRYKTMFFEMDYVAMFHGAVIHSKDDAIQDDIVTSDNCNASLSILEADGLFEKEKVNRLGNKLHRIPTRYHGQDGYWQMQNDYNHVLGSVLPGTFDIIYSREYSIFNQEVKGSFSACHDFVMKNYFTSVWAKYRTYSLIPYNESIVRAENIRELLLLSKDESYYEKTDIDFSLPMMLSAFSENVVDDNTNFVDYSNVINTAIIEIGSDKYLSDINAFACGYSLCLNLKTYDNISAGDYVSALHDSTINDDVLEIYGVKTYATTQEWYSMVENKDNAFIKDMTFTFCHMNFDFFGVSLKNFREDSGLIPYSYELSYKMPGLNYDVIDELKDLTGVDVGKQTNVISSSRNICKDNKEIIDMTYQFEFYSKDKDIIFTPYLNKLNNLISTDAFLKFEESKKVARTSNAVPFSLKAWSAQAKNTQIYIAVDRQFIDDQQYIDPGYDQINLEQAIDLVGSGMPAGQVSRTSLGYAVLRLKRITGGGVSANTPYINVEVEIKKYRKDIVPKYNYPYMVIEYETTDTFLETENDYIRLEVAETDSDAGIYYLRTPQDQVREYKITYQSAFGQKREITRALAVGYFNSSWVAQTYRGKGVNSTWDDLKKNNSQWVSGGFDKNSDYQTFKDKSMYVAISEHKLDKHLLQDSFDYTQLEDSMLVDTDATNYACKKNEDTYFLISSKPWFSWFAEFVPVYSSNYFRPTIVSGGQNALQVLASKIPDILKAKAKSIQYWWKDDNDIMHLVFALNFDEPVDTNVYISALKQRSIKVYNLEHVYMGDVTNYSETDAYKQEEEIQYYSSGAIKKRIEYNDGTETGNVYYLETGSDEVQGPIDEYILS